MSKRQKKKITIGSDAHLLGIEKHATTIYVGRTNRFGIDIDTYKMAVNEVEAYGSARRTKLFDLYTTAMMDCHLKSIIEKRKSKVLKDPIEFVKKDGSIDDEIGVLIKSPWFSRLMEDALDSIFWGFTLVQFFYADDGWMDYELIPRKHVDPINRRIIPRQSDMTGMSFDEFEDLLLIGNPRNLGLLLQAVPWTIYKRNSIGDWAQYNEQFGMPLQEYTYDAADNEMRKQIKTDAYNRGSLGVFIHPEGSNLRLLDSSDKRGSGELYDGLASRADNEMSKLILGNTLTTEAGKIGTQALGEVQQEGEDDIIDNDRKNLLYILNYDLSDIFARFGINTTDGEFRFSTPRKKRAESWVNTAQRLHMMGVPISMEQLYDETGFLPPKDEYDAIIKTDYIAHEEIGSPPDGTDKLEKKIEEKPKAQTPKRIGKRISSRARRSLVSRVVSTITNFFRPRPRQTEGRGQEITEAIEALYQEHRCPSFVAWKEQITDDTFIDSFIRSYYHNITEDIRDDLFETIWGAYEEALQKGRAFDPDLYEGKKLYDDMRFQTAIFAAAKADTIQRLLKEKAVDQDGVLMDFDKYYNAVRGVVERQLNQHLMMESDTLVMRMHEHSDWKRFEADVDVWPNLKWMQTTSIEHDQVHRRFWEIPLVLPVGDERWKKQRPGDHWGCKCMLEQTDDDPTPEEDIPTLPYKPSRGLEYRINEHKPMLIGTKHPYYEEADKDMAERAYDCVVRRHGIRPGETVEARRGWEESEDKLFYRTLEGIKISKWADPTEVGVNMRTAKVLKKDHPNMDVTIREHLEIFARANPEYEIDGAIGDGKRITKEESVKNGFNDAKRQGFSRIVIDLDHHIAPNREVKISVLAKKLAKRREDFEEGRITHCDIVAYDVSVTLEAEDIYAGEDRIEEILRSLETRGSKRFKKVQKKQDA